MRRRLIPILAPIFLFAALALPAGRAQDEGGPKVPIEWAKAVCYATRDATYSNCVDSGSSPGHCAVVAWGAYETCMASYGYPLIL